MFNQMWNNQKHEARERVAQQPMELYLLQMSGNDPWAKKTIEFN